MVRKKGSGKIVFVVLTITFAFLILWAGGSIRYRLAEIPATQSDASAKETTKQDASVSSLTAEDNAAEEKPGTQETQLSAKQSQDAETGSKPNSGAEVKPFVKPSNEIATFTMPTKPPTAPSQKPAGDTVKLSAQTSTKTTTGPPTDSTVTPTTESGTDNTQTEQEGTGTDSESETASSLTADTTSTAPAETTSAPTAKAEGGTKYIAFTFDDGPSASTAKLLDALAKNKDKVTFFVVGQMVDGSNGKLVTRAAKEGHEIGNHSYSHPNLTKLSASQLKKELDRTDNAVIKRTGKKPTLLRPPGGSYNSAVLKAAGRPVIIWSKDPQDWKYRDRSYVKNKVLKQAKDGDIYLLHDLHKTSVDGFIDALPELHRRGFKLVTVSELMKIKGIKMRAGSKYNSAR